MMERSIAVSCSNALRGLRCGPECASHGVAEGVCVSFARTQQGILKNGADLAYGNKFWGGGGEGGLEIMRKDIFPSTGFLFFLDPVFFPLLVLFCHPSPSNGEKTKAGNK